MMLMWCATCPRVPPHFGAPSLADFAGLVEDDTEVEGDEEEEEDVMWLLSRAHDSPPTREGKGCK